MAAAEGGGAGAAAGPLVRGGREGARGDSGGSEGSEGPVGARPSALHGAGPAPGGSCRCPASCPGPAPSCPAGPWLRLPGIALSAGCGLRVSFSYRGLNRGEGQGTGTGSSPALLLWCWAPGQSEQVNSSRQQLGSECLCC